MLGRGIFWGDMLQRTLKKELCITQSGIRFLNMTSDDDVPYNMLMLLRLCSTWRSGMAVHHADLNAKEVQYYFFFVLVKQVQSVVSNYEPKPDWLEMCSSLLQMRGFLCTLQKKLSSF